MAVTTDMTSTFPFADARSRLESVSSNDDFNAVVANLPFEYELETALLFLGLLTFMKLDEAKQSLCLVGVSDTEHYRMAVANYNFTPSKYSVLLGTEDNSLVQAYKTGRPVPTDDWGTLSRKPESDDAARLNQADSGLASSFVYPLKAPAKGVLLFSYYQYPEGISFQQHDFMERYTDIVSECMAKRS